MNEAYFRKAECAVSESFTRQDLERDTIIGRTSLEGLVTPPLFTQEDLLRDTYVVSGNGFPRRLISLESLLA